MPNADYYLSGAWNAICDRCGKKFKSVDLRKTWDGWMVCSRDWEPRHPQDFVRPKPENPAPPWTRPDNLVLPLICTPNSRSAYVGSATVGCVAVGFIHPAYDPAVTE